MSAVDKPVENSTATPVDTAVDNAAADEIGEKLTGKQERFAHLIALGAPQTEAYRKIYRTKAKPQRVAEMASVLAANPKVAARVAELRKPVIAKTRYGLEEAMADCDAAASLALVTLNAGAAVAASQLKAKLNGLLVEDRRNDRRPLEDLPDDALQAAIREAAREAGVSVALPGDAPALPAGTVTH